MRVADDVAGLIVSSNLSVEVVTTRGFGGRGRVDPTNHAFIDNRRLSVGGPAGISSCGSGDASCSFSPMFRREPAGRTRRLSDDTRSAGQSSGAPPEPTIQWRLDGLTTRDEALHEAGDPRVVQ